MTVFDLPVRYQRLEFVVDDPEIAVRFGQSVLVDTRTLLCQKGVEPLASLRADPERLPFDQQPGGGQLRLRRRDISGVFTQGGNQISLGNTAFESDGLQDSQLRHWPVLSYLHSVVAQ